MKFKKIVLGVLMIFILFVVFFTLLKSRYDTFIYMPGVFGDLIGKVQ